MTHVVHPYSFRLGYTRNWRSRWFSSRKYKEFLKSDILTREYLEKKLRGMSVESVDIERTADVFHLIIKTARPGLVIGRKGEGVENLKREIIRILRKEKLELSREFKLSVEEVPHPDAKASIIAQMIAENLEKQLPFKRVMKQAMEKAMANKEVKGVKIALSGRLGGNEMSRREQVKSGRMPLQTLKADVDFIREKAHMSYGDIGIKVWIYVVPEKS